VKPVNTDYAAAMRQPASGSAHLHHVVTTVEINRPLSAIIDVIA